MNYLYILLSYLIGSIPSGLLLAKLKGMDIRKSGSGNIGATNVTRQLGKTLGILTLVADVAKALVPMLAVHWLLRDSGDHVERHFIVAMSGFAAFMGHLFPVYLKFRGGKGVATALGVFLYLEPASVLIALVVFVAVVYFSGYVSLGSLSAAALMPAAIWLVNGTPLDVALAMGIAFFIWLKHLDNIERLLRNEESSWKKKNGPDSE